MFAFMAAPYCCVDCQHSSSNMRKINVVTVQGTPLSFRHLYDALPYLSLITLNAPSFPSTLASPSSDHLYHIHTALPPEPSAAPHLLLITLADAPVCKEGQEAYHGAAKHEEVQIPCQVDAHPLPTSFKWTFNNSGESVDIPQVRRTAGDPGVGRQPNQDKPKRNRIECIIKV